MGRLKFKYDDDDMSSPKQQIHTLSLNDKPDAKAGNHQRVRTPESREPVNGQTSNQTTPRQDNERPQSILQASDTIGEKNLQSRAVNDGRRRSVQDESDDGGVVINEAPVLTEQPADWAQEPQRPSSIRAVRSPIPDLVEEIIEIINRQDIEADERLGEHSTNYRSGMSLSNPGSPMDIVEDYQETEQRLFVLPQGGASEVVPPVGRAVPEHQKIQIYALDPPTSSERHIITRLYRIKPLMTDLPLFQNAFLRITASHLVRITTNNQTGAGIIVLLSTQDSKEISSGKLVLTAQYSNRTGVDQELTKMIVAGCAWQRRVVRNRDFSLIWVMAVKARDVDDVRRLGLLVSERYYLMLQRWQTPMPELGRDLWH